MIPLTVNFDVRTNANYGETFEIINADPGILVGKTFHLQARSSAESTDVLIDISTGSGISVVDNALLVEFDQEALEDAYDALLPDQPSTVRTLVHDMKMTDGLDTEIWFEGVINIRHGVTQ